MLSHPAIAGMIYWRTAEMLRDQFGLSERIDEDEGSEGYGGGNAKRVCRNSLFVRQNCKTRQYVCLRV
jgi:hypothetical protein